jgi:hypothetical protein
VTQLGIADEESLWFVYVEYEGQTFHLDVGYFSGVGNVRVAVYPPLLSWVLRRDHSADLRPFVQVVTQALAADSRIRDVAVGTEFLAP